jgi:hypothetical protein
VCPTGADRLVEVFLIDESIVIVLSVTCSAVPPAMGQYIGLVSSNAFRIEIR